MALNGTLEELAVLDVVQFVNQAHLSGVLRLKTAAEEAELFYRKGSLVDARLGESTGLEVLVRIVDWTKGSFVFDSNAVASAETIRMDLHRAVMYALKTRDERKLEAETRKAAETPKPIPEISFQDRFASLIAPLEFVRQAAVFDANALLAATSRNGGSAEDLGPLCRALSEFSSAYVRGRLRRGIFDDENGTVLLSGLKGNRWVVIVAERSAALGAVTVGMGRLVAKLETLGSEIKIPSREILARAV